MKRKRRRFYLAPNSITRHHIKPKSVGGGDEEENIAKVQNKHHQLYHQLFITREPCEIITWLVKYFWANHWEYVEQALERRGHERKSD